MNNCNYKKCDSIAYSRGFCRKHYVWLMRHGELSVIMQKGQYEHCSVEGCLGKHFSKSYCVKHYEQVRAHGRVQAKEDVAVRYAKRPVARYWLGKKMCASTVEAVKKANIGRRPWNKVGEGITSQNRLERNRFRVQIQPLVLARDNYTCQMCDQYSGYLHVDHIKGWAEYPELRFNMDNCRTLCRVCHFYITFKRKLPTTSTWGIMNMTRERG